MHPNLPGWMTFANFKDLVAAVAPFATVLMAWKGLQNWRHQLRANIDPELARRFRAAAFKLREAIADARSSGMTSEEQSSALAEDKIDLSLFPEEMRRQVAIDAAWNVRFKRVWTAREELQLVTYDVEAVWGPEVARATEPLFRLVHEFWVTMKMDRVDRPAGGTDVDHQRVIDRMLILTHADFNGPNRFTAKVNAGVDGIVKATRDRMPLVRDVDVPGWLERFREGWARLLSGRRDSRRAQPFSQLVLAGCKHFVVSDPDRGPADQGDADAA